MAARQAMARWGDYSSWGDGAMGQDGRDRQTGRVRCRAAQVCHGLATAE